MASLATLLKPRAARLPVSVRTAFLADGESTEVTVVNVTIYGFMAETASPVEIGQAGALVLPSGDELPAEVRWTEGSRFGARFTPAIRTYTLAKILARGV